MKDIKLALFLLVILLLSTYKLNAQWKQTNGPFGGNIISIDVNVNGYLFATSQDWGLSQPNVNTRIFISSDEGATWTQINNLPESNSYYFAFTKMGNVYLGSNYGLYFSVNNGENWSKVLSNQITAITVSSQGTILAGLYNKLLRSTDSGQSWDTISLDRKSVV